MSKTKDLWQMWFECSLPLQLTFRFTQYHLLLPSTLFSANLFFNGLFPLLATGSRSTQSRIKPRFSLQKISSDIKL